MSALMSVFLGQDLGVQGCSAPVAGVRGALLTDEVVSTPPSKKVPIFAALLQAAAAQGLFGLSVKYCFDLLRCFSSSRSFWDYRNNLHLFMHPNIQCWLKTPTMRMVTTAESSVVRSVMLT